MVSVSLKCVTLRFANNADMIETPLRSIIRSGTWRSILTPAYSTMTSVIVRTFNVSNLIPLSHDIIHVRDSIIGIQRPSLILLPTCTLFSFPWYNILVITSLACKLFQCDITERAQSISIRHRDWQIPLLIHEPQHNTFVALNPPL